MREKKKLKRNNSTLYYELSPGDIIREYISSQIQDSETELRQMIVLSRLNNEPHHNRRYYCYILKSYDDYVKVGSITHITSFMLGCNEWEIVVESGLTWDDD
jgi:hypothetical protein